MADPAAPAPARLIAAHKGAMRVDRFLAQHLDGHSRSSIQRWLEEGRVRVDGVPCRAKAKVFAGSVVEYAPSAPPPLRAAPDPTVAVDVIYEDEALIVLDKPAGLVVHPGRGNWDGTLVNGLLALPEFSAVPDPLDPEGAMRPGIVHRIDKDTSGLLVVAKTALAREGLKAQFAEHSVRRSYLALTLGAPRPGLIETAHGRHPTRRTRFTSLGVEGKRAATEVVVEETFGDAAALVRCRLQTGRTHQIRVHLSEQCHTPLLADSTYGRSGGPPWLRSIASSLGRQALHAAELGFIHPLRGGLCHFESPLPPDMEDALARLRAAIDG